MGICAVLVMAAAELLLEKVHGESNQGYVPFHRVEHRAFDSIG
jgi:hypothetical protein